MGYYPHSDLHMSYSLRASRVRVQPQGPPSLGLLIKLRKKKICGTFNKFLDFFVQAFKIVIDLKIDYVIAIHLMR